MSQLVRLKYATTQMFAVGGNVVLNRQIGRGGRRGFVVETSWIEGEIYVNNLCYAKRVGVWYTVDNGATSQGSDGHYLGPATEGTHASSAGAEGWAFKTPELNFNAASDTFRSPSIFSGSTMARGLG